VGAWAGVRDSCADVVQGELAFLGDAEADDAAVAILAFGFVEAEGVAEDDEFIGAAGEGGGCDLKIDGEATDGDGAVFDEGKDGESVDGVDAMAAGSEE
jgi:hypothetical protein